MKLRLPFIFLILGCCLCSCEYNFYPEGLDKGSKLYVQCIAGNSDTTYINIQKAMGINSGGEIMPDVESISLKINGKESSIKKYVLPDPPEYTYPDYPYFETKDSPVEPIYIDDLPYYILKRYNMWYTDAPIKEGDNVSLEVRAKGMEEVSASAKVPQEVVVKEIKASPRCTTITDFDFTYRETYMSFDISLEGASPDDYYGITVMQEQDNILSYDDGRVETYNNKGYGRIINWSESDSEIMSELQATGGAWIDSYYNGYFIDSYGANSMKLVSGNILKDGHLQFDCSIFWSEDHESTYAIFDEVTNMWVDGGSLTVTRDARYKLLIYKVSPEFFRFNKAQYLLETNYLAELGLSPSTYSYTNIKGGFGVLGTLTCTATPWYPAPAEPEQ